MKSYYVKTNNIPSLKSALSRLIEYAKFLEEESGRADENFVDTILEDDNIVCDVVEE